MKIWLQISKYGFHVLFVLFCVMAFFYVKSHRTLEPTPPTPPTHSVTPNPADLLPGLTKTTISSKKDGQKDWELTAEKISMDNVAKKAKAEKVRCLFYDPKGKLYLDFSSPLVYANLDTNSLYFPQKSFGKLVKSGESITVSKLFWIGKERLLKGYGGVTIEKNEYNVSSLEMVFDPAINRLELIKNVSGVWLGDILPLSEKSN